MCDGHFKSTVRITRSTQYTLVGSPMTRKRCHTYDRATLVQWPHMFYNGTSATAQWCMLNKRAAPRHRLNNDTTRTRRDAHSARSKTHTNTSHTVHTAWRLQSRALCRWMTWCHPSAVQGCHPSIGLLKPIFIVYASSTWYNLANNWT